MAAGARQESMMCAILTQSWYQAVSSAGVLPVPEPYWGFGEGSKDTQCRAASTTLWPS